MTEPIERIKAKLALLSSKERAELAHFLLQSLESEEVGQEVETTWDAELQLRAKEIKTGQAVGEPVEKVIAELRKLWLKGQPR